MNYTPLEYRMVYGGSSSELTKKVNNLLQHKEEIWSLYGEPIIIISPLGGELFCYQAMTRDSSK